MVRLSRLHRPRQLNPGWVGTCINPAQSNGTHIEFGIAPISRVKTTVVQNAQKIRAYFVSSHRIIRMLLTCRLKT
jgi:hypothetical protein